MRMHVLLVHSGPFAILFKVASQKELALMTEGFWPERN